MDSPKARFFLALRRRRLQAIATQAASRITPVATEATTIATVRLDAEDVPVSGRKGVLDGMTAMLSKATEEELVNVETVDETKGVESGRVGR